MTKTPSELLEERGRQLSERHVKDIAKMLLTPEGRRVVWGLMADAGVFRSSFVPGDPHQTSLNEGKRDIGLGILNTVMAARPDALQQMSLEFTSEEVAFNARYEAALAEQI